MLNSTNRRRFLAATAAALPAGRLRAARAAPAGLDDAAPTPADLAPTPWIDAVHPRIVQLAADITRDAATPREAAVRVHDWVRDRIPFGIPPDFYALRASEVLDAGVGYCNTKTTLFSALLRAVGIPTRTHMFDLSAEVLRGLFDPRTAYVDHAVTELWLDGRWVGVDSYVVDLPLARAAAARLRAEGRGAGWGIHIAGSSTWDGFAPARIQCVEAGAPAGWVRADHGRFVDIGDFYERTPEARNRLGFVNGVLIRLASSGINRSIEAVRRGDTPV